MSELTDYLSTNQGPKIAARLAELNSLIAAQHAILDPLEAEKASLLLVKSQMDEYVASIEDPET